MSFKCQIRIFPLLPFFPPIEHTLITSVTGQGAVTGAGKYFTDENATFTATLNPSDSNSLNGYHLSFGNGPPQTEVFQLALKIHLQSK